MLTQNYKFTILVNSAQINSTTPTYVSPPHSKKGRLCLTAAPSFLAFPHFLFKFSYFSKSASFRSIISSIRSMYSVIFFTFSTRIRFVSLPLLVLIFSGKTSFVVEPAPQAIIVWRSSKVLPCLDTKIKENKLSLIKLIFQVVSMQNISFTQIIINCSESICCKFWCTFNI